MNNLGSLPFEIISLILQNVPQKDLFACTLINKQFYTTTKPLLWRTLSIKKQTTFMKIISSWNASHHYLGQHVRHVHLRSPNDPMLRRLMKHVPELETLKLTFAASITDNSLQHVPRHCPNLTSLTLVNGSITTRSIVSLGQHCRRLRKLELKRTPLLSSTILLTTALAHCPLQELVISTRLPDHTIFDPNWLSGMDTSTAVLGLGQFSGLRKLSISSHSFIGDFGAHILQTTAPYWPHLTQLSLSHCKDITTSQLDAFVQSHPRIKDLELKGLSSTVAFFRPIANHLSGIQSLVLAHHGRIKPRSLCHFIHQCPSLTYAFFLDDAVFSRNDFPGVFNEYDDDGHQPYQQGEFFEDIIKKIRQQPDPGESDDSDQDEENMDDNDDDDD